MSLPKIAIVAKASTNMLAPWHDEEWEIWGMPWISYPRVDKLFEIHEEDCLKDSNNKYLANNEWIKDIPPVPLYCMKSKLYLPNSIEYPLEEVKKILPIHYLENSVAYMMALAIYEGAEEIGLWGVHMRGMSEYEAERPSVTYLIGLAQGLGIKVTIPPGSPLMASRWEAGRYGVSIKTRLQHPCFTN